MKSIKQIKEECIGEVFTLKEFISHTDIGLFNRYDGDGYFHDGENETNISVWDSNLAWEDVENYPYVCWYNK